MVCVVFVVDEKGAVKVYQSAFELGEGGEASVPWTLPEAGILYTSNKWNYEGVGLNVKKNDKCGMTTWAMIKT